jgi:glutamyl endopeptidase
VLGGDDRSPVVDTTEYPSRAIGRLTFRQRGASFFCTAFLISADTVATAGHCVHDGLAGSTEGFSVDVVFTPGQDGVGATSAPFGSCAGVEVTGSDPWLQGRDERFDIGFVRLDCTVGDTVGWFGFEPGGTGAVAGVAVMVQGYPFDKPSGTQWTDDDVVDLVGDRQSFYGADTAPGQSGSPVFQMRTCRGAAGACVVAVHAYGVHGVGPHATLNHGTTVTAAVAGQFHAAVESATG